MGSPVGSVHWIRNGVYLRQPEDNVDGAQIRLLSPYVLEVVGVTRHHRGMYQCIVRNARESSQGSAELRLGGKNCRC